MATLDDFTPVLPEVIANLPQAVMLVDADSLIHFGNNGAAELFGYERGELEGMALDNLVTAAWRDQHRRQVREFIVAGNQDPQGAHRIDCFARRQNGSEFPAEISLTRLDAPGAPTMAMVIVCDGSARTADDRLLRQHLERAVAGSEALVALDIIEDNVVVLDREWRYLFANDAMLRLNGLDRTEILGKTYWEVFPDLVGTPVDQALRQAFDGPEKITLEQKIAASGRWYRVDIIASATTLVAYSTDVTALKQTGSLNQQLMHSLDSINDPIFMMDRQWCYTFANIAAASFAGRSREELLGQNIWELSPWLLQTPFGQACERAMAGGEPFSIEDHYKPRDRWLKVHYFPGPDGFTVHIADITSLKLSQLHVTKLLEDRSSEKQLHAAFDLMPNPMLMLDSKLRYTYANAAAMKANNRTPDMIGSQMWELNPALKGSELAKRTRQALKSGKRQQFEVHLPPSGRWMRVEAIPWADQVILAGVDITKQKDSEKSVGILTASLEQAMDHGWNRPNARDSGKRPPNSKDNL